MATTTQHTTETRVLALSTMTTKDAAGRHFTQRYHSDILTDLEAEGLIEIYRPVHERTGFVYIEEHWSVEVTEEGQRLVEAYPEFWNTES